MTSLADLERQLFQHAAHDAASRSRGPIFILGAPRTGSTILYQTLVEAFGLPFFANLTNAHFADTPIIGLSVQASWPIHGAIAGESRFGKVEGLLQPSEASAVMTHWFGGGHPSELLSPSALPGREPHLKATVAAAWQLFERPLVIKNAWNCFRIDYLAEALPGACFIWIRRDLAASAKSDLHARRVVQRDTNVWNSATPRNWEELRRRPPHEQVVENQVEFSRAISAAARRLEGTRFAEVWYEDFIAEPEGSLRRLSQCLAALAGASPGRLLPILRDSPARLEPGEAELIDGYVRRERDRLAHLRHASADHGAH